MNVQNFPSAIYHCPVPLKAASAVYESSIDGRKSLPIPAWPDIENPNRWCCLPSLKRAIFVGNQKRDLPLTAFEEMFPMLLSKPSLRKIDRRIMSRQIDRIVTSVKKGLSIAHTFTRVWSQYRGEIDTFSLLHEVGHLMVGKVGMYSAFRQSTESDKVHRLLETITTAPQLSFHDLRQLWAEFSSDNLELSQLVQRFAVFEETIASIIALIACSFAGPSVMEGVADELEEAIEKEGYGYFFRFFLKWVDDVDDFDQVLVLMELFALHLDYIKMIKDKLSEPLIWHEPTWMAVLAMAGKDLKSIASEGSNPSLDDADQWMSSKCPTLEPVVSKLQEFRRTSQAYPLITIHGLGNSARVEIPVRGSISESAIMDECFWESLRQQICRVCGLTCPFKLENESCCGREDLMGKLWDRLPQVYRRALKRPTCGSRA